MKKLSEYINKSNIIENYIDYSILQHLAIEYKENNLYSKNHIILEKYGVYDGCEELAQFIYDKVEKEGMDNQYEFTKDELLKFSNIFFEKIVIDIDTSEDKGGEYLDNEVSDLVYIDDNDVVRCKKCGGIIKQFVFYTTFFFFSPIKNTYYSGWTIIHPLFSFSHSFGLFFNWC